MDGAVGEYAAARDVLTEGLTIARAIGNRTGVASHNLALGQTLLDQGDPTAAVPLFHDSLLGFQEVGPRSGVAWALEGLAGVAAAHGAPERAARLLGAADGLREILGAPLTPAGRVQGERRIAPARHALSESAWATTWSEGRAMTLEQAIAYALENDAVG